MLTLLSAYKTKFIEVGFFFYYFLIPLFCLDVCALSVYGIM